VPDDRIFELPVIFPASEGNRAPAAFGECGTDSMKLDEVRSGPA
jgi:hypothetical protein